jgi:hypothetical protein
MEGEGEGAIRINFESEQERDDYLAWDMRGAGNLPGLCQMFDVVADNPNTGSFN